MEFYSTPFVFFTDAFTGEVLCGGDVGRGHSFRNCVPFQIPVRAVRGVEGNVGHPRFRLHASVVRRF